MVTWRVVKSPYAGVQHVELLPIASVYDRRTLCGRSPLGWEVSEPGWEIEEGTNQRCRVCEKALARTRDAAFAPDRRILGVPTRTEEE